MRSKVSGEAAYCFPDPISDTTPTACYNNKLLHPQQTQIKKKTENVIFFCLKKVARAEGGFPPKTLAGLWNISKRGGGLLEKPHKQANPSRGNPT